MNLSKSSGFLPSNAEPNHEIVIARTENSNGRRFTKAYRCSPERINPLLIGRPRFLSRIAVARRAPPRNRLSPSTVYMLSGNPVYRDGGFGLFTVSITSPKGHIRPVPVQLTKAGRVAFDGHLHVVHLHINCCPCLVSCLCQRSSQWLPWDTAGDHAGVQMPFPRTLTIPEW